MFNFNVPPLVQRERIEICKKCKFYNVQFGTCGTPLIGGTVDPEENSVTYYKEKIKLCGCFMSHKVKYRFTSCPASKWHALNWSQTQIERLDKFIGKISKANKIEDEDRQQLYDWYGQITGRREQASACASCIRDLINEFRRQLGKVNETK
jgi:hypothetical protein